MKPTRILIVDDESNVRLAVRACLETAGYATEEATNGREALDLIQRNPPDLVLLDLAMPVMDGMTVLSKLWAQREENHTRVVVMTAHGSVRTAIQAIRLGATDFLEKPLLPEDLRLSVASALHEFPAADLELDYGGLLHYVRQALRSGRFHEAEALLMKAGMITDCDAAFLNLAGVLHEAHGRKESARRFYQRAVEADSHYDPGRHNLARSYELQMYGQTRQQVWLGEDMRLLDSFPVSPAQPAPEEKHAQGTGLAPSPSDEATKGQASKGD